MIICIFYTATVHLQTQQLLQLHKIQYLKKIDVKKDNLFSSEFKLFKYEKLTALKALLQFHATVV